MLNDKTNLRQYFRIKRQTITSEKRFVASQLLLEHIRTQPWYLPSQNFALYLAMAEEIDTIPLIQSLWSEQKNTYLPQIAADRTLAFAHYTAHTPLLVNRFGINEPPANTPICALEDLDVIFMPLVAFDAAGQRLGMGAGFYDKTLAKLAALKKRPLLVGLAYELQKADIIPQDEWDVCLDSVVTEQHVHIFSKK